MLETVLIIFFRSFFLKGVKDEMVDCAYKERFAQMDGVDFCNWKHCVKLMLEEKQAVDVVSKKKKLSEMDKYLKKLDVVERCVIVKCV